MGGPTACTQVSTKIAIFAYLTLTRSLFLYLSISSSPSSSLSSWSPSSPPSLRSRWQLRWKRRRAAAPSRPLGGKAARSGARGGGGRRRPRSRADAPGEQWRREAMRRRVRLAPCGSYALLDGGGARPGAAWLSRAAAARRAVVRWPRNGAVERGAARPTAGGGGRPCSGCTLPPFFLFFF